MLELGVAEDEFEESLIVHPARGRKKVNKSSSCVYLVHLPTGLSVKCQRERSQSLNRFLARRILLDEFERQQKGFIAEEKEKRNDPRCKSRKRSHQPKKKFLRPNISGPKQITARQSACR